jgi:hypothetical protein
MRRIVWLSLLAFAVLFTASAEWKHNFVTADTQTFKNLPELQTLLASRLKARTAEFNVDYSGDKGALSRGLKNTIKKAIAEDDYTAYVIDSYFYSIKSLGNTSKIRFVVEYRETIKQTDEVDRRIKQVIQSIITPGMNGHQRIKAVHDWIVLNVQYDKSLQRYTAYEALTDGTAVCQGYALLANKMLAAAGIPNKIVEGRVKNEDHAWNLVQLDGKWWHLDTTWDDPVPDKKGKVSYGYYMKTDKEIRRDHRWTKSYPVASTSYADTIAAVAAADSSRTGFYKQLEQDLEWIWLKPGNTVTSSAGLGDRLRKAAEDKTFAFKVRYTKGSQIKTDMKKAVQAVKGIRSYRYAATDFGSDGSVLLEVTFTTK